MDTFTQRTTVSKNQTASAMGSGVLDVFATPSMIAFMENTAIHIINDLETDYTTVGIEINAKHLKATKVGEPIACTANLIKHEGKLYEFEIKVVNSLGDTVGTGTHKRIAVNKERFFNSL